ncbi:MAG TPA: zinc ribbon domain-containing protein [Pyrinomonadaceae bacterium]|nr:zinc ribbon domain-containing protein [Pyrinomonadaceae bacterium]
MAVCANCGTNNIEGTKFCVGCGSQLGDAPPPESWRASSELGAPPAGATEAPRPQTDAGGYVPQVPPSYPAYNQSQTPAPGYGQPAIGGGSQPMHPAVAAVVSFFLPGIGLLFVPNKQGLGIGIFAATVGYAIVATILTFVVVGICLFIAMPLINIAAAIHSWDEAAKASGGQFQPILFK